MFMPSGTIYLIDAEGKEVNVMMTDIHKMEDFKDELKYLFEKCGYDITKYIEAIYKNKDNRITMRIILDELY